MEDQEEIIVQLEKLDLTLSNIRRTFKQIESKIELYKNKNDQLVNNFEPWINFFDLNENKKNHDNEEQLIASNTTAPNSIAISTDKQSAELHKDEESHDTKQDQNVFAHENSDSSSLVDLDYNMLPAIFKNEKVLFEAFKHIQSAKKVSLNDLFMNCKEGDKLKLLLNILVKKKMIKIEDNYVMCKK